MTWLRRNLTILSRRFAKRPDTEHQQALLRVAFTAMIAAYLGSVRGPETALLNFDGTFVAAIWFLCSVPILLWIAVSPGVSHLRRLIGMIGDFGSISLGLLLEGEVSTPLFLLYLWVALGNGFRYGLRALILATAISASFFGAVLVLSPFWRTMPELSIGLLMCVVLIPLYTASLIKQLTEAKEQADRANRAKSRFLAVMSHELRTPLNAIIGANDVLLGTKMDVEQVAMTRTIGQAGRSLLALIEDVLDLSRIEAGKERVERRDFDLYADLSETTSMLQIQARRKSLTLSLQIAAEVPTRVFGGQRQLRQILFNLIANAIKFTEAGSVRLRVRPTPSGQIAFDVIDTGVGIEQAHMERIFDSFTQADESIGRRHDGAGLGLAIVKQLTELMSGSVTVQSVPGRGSVFTVELPLPEATSEGADALAPLPNEQRIVLVGRDPSVAAALTARGALVDIVDDVLAMRAVLQAGARSVVIDDRSLWQVLPLATDLLAAHRVVALTDTRVGGLSPDLEPFASGRVSWPADSPTIGRMLRLLAPAPADTESDEAVPDTMEEAAGSEQPVPTRLRAARVLVAEDNPVNRRVIEKILRRGGFDPVVVEDGDEALDRLESESFDLFIVDVNMPGTNGIDVVKLYSIQQLGQERIPIVALTADTTLETQRRCIEAGVDFFLPKPIEADRLLRTLSGLLTARGTAAAVVGAPDGSVADIASHPRFQSSNDQVIDRETLRELSELDSDASFLDEIVGIYIEDSELLLEQIEATVRNRDFAEFRDLIHALRSASANVGAAQLHATCVQLGGIDRRDFQARAPEYMSRLIHEFTRYRLEVQAWLERKAGHGRAT
ncbi:ATP-binding protein [Roseiterribacter gracilis]|uniref:histidine kinase n=1 Tax=Roseiterribacter gracilis TaxID=2812848 RepID=A0A8S8XCJ4_9PROT|nr:hypothetical protein TMPK1_39550 [Rhodospirillales bacterium TMPK1]